jgi:hypothetical protein
MPVACITLEETNRTILSSSYFKVIQDVLAQTNIPYGTLIAMHKGMEINRTDNTTNLTSEQKANLPSTVARRKVTVDITEEYNEDALSTTAVSYQDTTPIFVDNQIDLKIYPVYVTSDITLKVTFSTPSKSEANRLRDDLRIKLSQMRNIAHHEVEYDILVPEVVQELIADVHTLKSRLHPIELGEYFRTCSTKQAHMVTDQVGMNNAQLAIRERQVRIVGKFEFTSMPEAVEEDTDSNTYRLTIPYKFTMEVPRGMCMSYPPMVCNKPMPAKYLQWIADSKIKTREEYSRNLSYTSSMGALSHFEAHRQLDYRIQNKLPLNLPLFDEFPLRQGHPGCMVTTTFLTDVDESDGRTLFNLKELPDFYMDPKLLAFLQAGEREHVVIPYRSCFYFGLHYPGRFFDLDCLEITEDLTVRSKSPLPLDKPLRVAFSVLADPAFLTRTIQERWYTDKAMVLLYLSEYMHALTNYKHELSKILEDDLSFQKTVLVFLQRGLQDSDTEFLQTVLDICSTDNLVLETTVNLLRGRYRSTYTSLTKYTNIAQWSFHKSGKPYHSPALSHIPKTVMSTYVESHRR